MSKYIVSSFQEDCPPGHKGVPMHSFGPMLFVPLDMDNEEIDKEVDRANLERHIEQKTKEIAAIKNKLDQELFELKKLED